MFDQLPAWPIALVVGLFLLLTAISWGVLAQKNDEKNGTDETLERRREQ